jgi:hypothetical protein
MHSPGSGPMHGQGGPGGPPMGPGPGYGSGPYAQQPYPPGPPPGHPGASGMYPGDSAMLAPRRGKGGLIAIIIAAVVVIGGVIALVALSKNKDDKVAAASIDAAGEQAGGLDAGGAVLAAIDAGGGAEDAIDAGTAGEPAIDAGAERAVDAAGGVRGNTVVVLIHSRTPSAVVYDNGTRLGKVPQTVMVAAGEEHTVLLKAAGFKDEQFTVDGREPRVDVVMDRLGGGPGTGHGSGPGTGHGSGPGTGHGSSPPPPDCENDPSNPNCSM